MAIRRIIPVSSGKGGVGKTTFAINFSLALAQHGRVILADLDTGTSSIRNAIDTPIERDLYHFFKRDEALANCVTHLSPSLDPTGRLHNFGFIAAPLHLIEEITNFGVERKHKLIAALNSLDTDYLILDLKAGLDSNVLDFLPFSNSGILVFTPHLPSATLAASDIVKSILFRKLRLIFGRNSPFFSTVQGRLDLWKLINDLIDRVEDVYDDSIHNLDDFVADLYAALGDHPVARTVQSTIEEFRVHYVLNLFNGIEDSFNTAVKPFIENLTTNVSSRCGVTNLGWITKSDAIHQANVAKIPAMLTPWLKEKGTAAPKVDRYTQELEDLRITAIGLEGPRAEKKPATARPGPSLPARDQEDHLTNQLDVLRAMYLQKKNDDYLANFDYVTQRALFTMQNRRPSEFGDVRIFRPQEMLDLIFARSGK